MADTTAKEILGECLDLLISSEIKGTAQPLPPSVDTVVNAEFDSSDIELWAWFFYVFLCRDISRFPDTVRKYHPDSGSTHGRIEVNPRPDPYRGIKEVELAQGLHEMNNIMRYSQDVAWIWNENHSKGLFVMVNNLLGFNIESKWQFDLYYSQAIEANEWMWKTMMEVAAERVMPFGDLGQRGANATYRNPIKSRDTDRRGLYSSRHESAFFQDQHEMEGLVSQCRRFAYHQRVPDC